MGIHDTLIMIIWSAEERSFSIAGHGLYARTTPVRMRRNATQCNRNLHTVWWLGAATVQNLEQRHISSDVIPKIATTTTTTRWPCIACEGFILRKWLLKIAKDKKSSTASDDPPGREGFVDYSFWRIGGRTRLWVWSGTSTAKMFHTWVDAIQWIVHFGSSTLSLSRTE